MDKEALKHFEDLLQAKVETLLGKADQSLGDLTDETTPNPDPNDQASMETDRDFLIRIRDRERNLILKAREALARINDGSYGHCESCGEEISLARLEARPEATLCIDCKTEMEQRERRRPLRGTPRTP